MQRAGTAVALVGAMPDASEPADHAGFGLIEVVVAAGVLVTGLAAVLHLFVIAAGATSAARDATYAAVLALQKVEELRAAPFPAPGGATEYLDARGALVAPGDGVLYERRWSAEPLAAQPADTMVVTVHVSRRGVAGRGVRLVTLRTRRGA